MSLTVSAFFTNVAQSLNALRNASDQVFEWMPEAIAVPENVNDKPAVPKADPLKPAVVRRRSKFVADAVALLAGNTAEGQVHLGTLGQYLKRTDPGFSPANYGHSGLLDMLKTYDLLALKREQGGNYTVGLCKLAQSEANAEAHIG